jgi:hypothetical protein
LAEAAEEEVAASALPFLAEAAEEAVAEEAVVAVAVVV